MSNDQNPKDSSSHRREGIKRRDLLLSGTSLVAAAAVSGTVLPSSAQAQEVLPFPPKPSGSTANRTMQESVYSPRAAVRRLPDKAPNILIVLIDDVGPALPSTYGGEINTPTLDRIAQRRRLLQPLPHHRHVLADPRGACSPGATTTASATGRLRSLRTTGTAIPASSRSPARPSPRFSRIMATPPRPWASGTIPRPTKPPPPARSSTGPPATASNISTASSPARPRNTNRTLCATRPSCTPTSAGQAVSSERGPRRRRHHWLRNQKAFQPDKPFFMYWASGASHGPHHIMKEWADKYKGKFDDGWDKYRERAFARAKEMGWIPQDAQLTHGRRRWPPGTASRRAKSRSSAG